MSDYPLAKLEAAKNALALCQDLDEVKAIRDMAEAARTYAKAASLGLEAQNHAAEIKLRAERRAGEILAEMELKPGRPKSLHDERISTPPTLKDIGVSEIQSHRWQTIARVPESVVEKYIAQKSARRDEITTSGLVKIAKRAERAQERAALVAAANLDCSSLYRLYVGALGSDKSGVGEEAIDALITDPPYGREALPLYSTLSSHAAAVLKPGGSLLVMCGQSYLPEVLKAMTDAPSLNYQWTLSYLTPGGQAPQMWQRKVNTFWKPVLWYVKGKYSGEWIGDVIRSAVNDNDKRFHDWGQSESGTEEIIERFTKPGQCIYDPFLGGGTIGVVAVRLGRQFVGGDISADAVSISKQRIEECLQTGP